MCALLTGIYCYACSSYLGQCGDRVDDSKATVFKSRCAGPCFVRRGEDDGMLGRLTYGSQLYYMLGTSGLFFL